MRLYLLSLSVLVTLFVSLEASRGKNAWKHKKLKHLSKFSELKGGAGDLDYLSTKKKSFHGLPLIPGEGFHSRKFGRKMKDKYLKKKHGDRIKKHHKKMSWLKIKAEDKCNMECKHGEVCISGPIDKRPICVGKKDLKKSVKLFHRYHKKEMKSWRKFQKKNYKKDSKWLKKQEKLERKKNRNIVALKEYHMKKTGYDDFLKKSGFENDMKREEFEKMKKEELEKRIEKEEFEKLMKKKKDLDKYMKKEEFEKLMKKSMKEPSHDFKDSMKELDFKYPLREVDLKKSVQEGDFKDSMLEGSLKESVQEGGYSDSMEELDSKELAIKKEQDIPKDKDSEDMEGMSKEVAWTSPKSLDKGECTPGEFAQMRTRMMGWFHLLHGQDHLARKAHGGDIGKFYKHVSVKKELREHDGVKCGCLKSAMWEFHQLDKSQDDHLSPDELAMLEENNLEPCMKPYLESCDMSGDGKLSSDEWCCCFSHILAPCMMKVEEIKKSKDKDAFIPRCDREGYYMREQCRTDEKNRLFCWCVDINGNELKDTASHGRAHCSKLAKLNIGKKPFF